MSVTALPQDGTDATFHDTEGYELVNLAAIIRQCRIQVCEAYFSGRHQVAIAALAAASIRLYRYVDNGSLIGEIAYRNLREVADNLTLTKVLGEDARSEEHTSELQSLRHLVC